MKVKKLYQDKAGNKLQIEDGKLAGRNKQNRLVSKHELSKLVKRDKVRQLLVKKNINVNLR